MNREEENIREIANMRHYRAELWERWIFKLYRVGSLSILKSYRPPPTGAGCIEPSNILNPRKAVWGWCAICLRQVSQRYS